MGLGAARVTRGPGRAGRTSWRGGAGARGWGPESAAEALPRPAPGAHQPPAPAPRHRPAAAPSAPHARGAAPSPGQPRAWSAGTNDPANGWGPAGLRRGCSEGPRGRRPRRGHRGPALPALRPPRPPERQGRGRAARPAGRPGPLRRREARRAREAGVDPLRLRRAERAGRPPGPTAQARAVRVGKSSSAQHLGSLVRLPAGAAASSASTVSGRLLSPRGPGRVPRALWGPTLARAPRDARQSAPGRAAPAPGWGRRARPRGLRARCGLRRGPGGGSRRWAAVGPQGPGQRPRWTRRCARAGRRGRPWPHPRVHRGGPWPAAEELAPRALPRDSRPTREWAPEAGQVRPGLPGDPCPPPDAG